MGDVGWVTAAAVAFVGSHFALSHPLRAPLVGGLGERGFLGLYSLVAALTLGGLVWTFQRAPATAPLWAAGEGVWGPVTLVMLLAAILLMGSVVGNPALPTGGAPLAAPAEARGVFAITRHPMMWAVALWGACHIAVWPVAKNIVLALAMIVLALAGAALQDAKKARLQGESWRAWEERTSFWPFAAIAAGRARFGGFRPHALLGGVVVWLAATWAHIPAAHVAAGVWRWILR